MMPGEEMRRGSKSSMRIVMMSMVMLRIVRMWDGGSGGNEEGVKVLDEASLPSQGQLLNSHLVEGS